MRFRVLNFRPFFSQNFQKKKIDKKFHKKIIKRETRTTMLATAGWSSRGLSEMKIFSMDEAKATYEERGAARVGSLKMASSVSSRDEEDFDALDFESRRRAETMSATRRSTKATTTTSGADARCIEWSKTDQAVALGLSDGRVVLVDEKMAVLGQVKEEDFERRSVITRGKEKTDVLTFAESSASSYEVTSMDFHSSSRYLAVGGTSNTVNVWDLKTKRVARRLGARTARRTATAQDATVNAVKFNKDDRVIACGSEEGEIVLHRGGERFDEEDENGSKKEYWEPLSAFDVNKKRANENDDESSMMSSSAVNCLDFSPHARMMLAAGTSGGNLNVYDCESESLETRFQSSEVKNNIIHSIAFSPTAPRIVAIANDDGSVSLRDVAMHPKTGVCLHIPNPNKRWMDSSSDNGTVFGTAGAASSVSWHPSGDGLAVGYRGNGVVAVYDCRNVRSHMDERNSKNRNIRMNGSNRFYCRDTSEEFYGDHSRVLFETEAHEGGRVVGLKWQHGEKKKSRAKSNTHDGGSDKENRLESKERRQQQKQHLNDATETTRKSLENLNATTTHTQQQQQQQQVLITADAISDEVSKKTKEVVKTCLEKEVKSLRADVRNLHVELLRVQEENAVMFRKLHEQQLELVDALSNNTNGRH